MKAIHKVNKGTTEEERSQKEKLPIKREVRDALIYVTHARHNGESTLRKGRIAYTRPQHWVTYIRH